MQTSNNHGSLITALAVRCGSIGNRQQFDRAVCEVCQPETDVYKRFGELIEKIDADGMFKRLQSKVWKYCRFSY